MRCFFALLLLFALSFNASAQISFTVTMTSASDNAGAWVGPILSGQQTDDASPTFVVTTSTTLSGTLTPHVYRDGSYIGNATWSGSNNIWAFTDSGSSTAGVHAYTARICKNTDEPSCSQTGGNGIAGPYSAAFYIVYSACTAGPTECQGSSQSVSASVNTDGITLAWMGVAVLIFGVGMIGGLRA